MKKPRGRWLRFFLIVGLVAIATLGVIRLLLPGWIHSSIESRASAQLGLAVEIEKLRLSVTGGRLSLEGIRVLPHEGIGNRDVLTIGKLSIDLRWSSMWNRVIDIEEFLLQDVDFLALRGDGGARNIGPALMRFRKEKKPKSSSSAPSQTIAQATPTPTPSASRETSPAKSRTREEVWGLKIRRADISNVTLTVRSIGEPSRQEGEASAKLGSLTIRDAHWPSESESALITIKDLELHGIGGHWPETRMVSLESATVKAQAVQDLLIIEDAIFQKPVLRNSWDHLKRDQKDRTEDLLKLVFARQDTDFEDPNADEDSPVASPAAAETPRQQSVAEVSPSTAQPIPRPVADDEEEEEKKSGFKTEIKRLQVVDANWIRQARLGAEWTDVVTSFDIEVTHSDGKTNTLVTGRSSYEGSEFEIRYVEEDDDEREIVIRARRMPFHQMFWEERVKDERAPRVEHVLYDLEVNTTHSKGLLLGRGLAAFSEVRITPDQRPFWQRISLDGGGWATILSELSDPATGNSRRIPFEVERPLGEFNFFVLYTELQAAFGQARLASLEIPAEE